MKAIRPGIQAGIVTEIDQMRETISVRSSTVYESEGDRIILAQTKPPLDAPHEGIIITYLADDSTAGRWGFPARIADVVRHTLAGGKEVMALVAARTGEAAPFSLRMFHRVQPAHDSRLKIFVNGAAVDILDISLRGACFRYQKDLMLESGRTITVSLDIGLKTYRTEGCLARTWESTDFSVRREFAFASVEFTAIDANTERALLHKLRQIERENRARQRAEEEDSTG